MRIHKQRVLAAIVASTVLATSGAYAFWTSSGSGSGQATAGTARDVDVFQTAVVTGLQPGGPSAALSGNFRNPNPFEIHYSSISARVPNRTRFSVAPDASKPPCTEADFVIEGTSGPGVVPAGPAVRTGAWSGLSVRMVSRPDHNQDNCKNVEVPIRYFLNP